jgi:hypothetical protein
MRFTIWFFALLASNIICANDSIPAREVKSLKNLKTDLLRDLGIAADLEYEYILPSGFGYGLRITAGNQSQAYGVFPLYSPHTFIYPYLTGIEIVPEFRYYPRFKSHAFNGLFIGAYAKWLHLKEQDIELDLDGGMPPYKKGPYKILHETNNQMLGIGIAAGYKFKIRHFTFELAGGVPFYLHNFEHYYLDMPLNQHDPSYPNLDPFAMLNRVEISIGYSW